MKNILTQNQPNVNIDLADIIVIRGIIGQNTGFQIVTKDSQTFISASRKQVYALEDALKSANWQVDPSLYCGGFRARPEGVQNGSIPFDGEMVDSPAERDGAEWVGVR